LNAWRYAIRDIKEEVKEEEWNRHEPYNKVNFDYELRKELVEKCA